MGSWVRMPKVGANIEEGMVATWHKGEGDPVRRGEPLVEIVTDKATFDVEAEEDGRLFRILAPEKSTVPVQYVMAVVGEEADALVGEAEAENRRILDAYRARAGAALPAAGATVPSAAHSQTKRRLRATPAARRLARQAQVSLEAVLPHAEGKVISEADVRRYLADRGPGAEGSDGE